MPDFSLMRQNMVKNQVLPEDVHRPKLIKALSTLPREKFFPRQLARVAYMDANFVHHKNRVLLRPATFARLVQSLNPKSSDKILYIAAGSGYGPAVLAEMGCKIIALDSDPSLTQNAESLFQELGLFSIDVVLGPLNEGWEQEAPYDKIFIEGSVQVIPESIGRQLTDKGSIVTLKYRGDKDMHGVKIVKDNNTFTEISLFEAFAPRLDAFSKRGEFVFE